MDNLAIAKILYNIANILELQEVEFKPRAYRNAARAIEELTEDINVIFERGELQQIPGVGRHIAVKIEELITTGKLKYYEDLKKETGINLEELLQIPSLGPKKIKLLYQKLGIKSVADLSKALQDHQIRELKGFGNETEKNLLQGIAQFAASPRRFLYVQVQPIVLEVKDYLSRCNSVKNIEAAGSFVRGKETIGDIDILATSSAPAKVMQWFVAYPGTAHIIAHGLTKSSIRTSSGMQIDLRVCKPSEFGSALLYFTGSKEHNVELRKRALSKGYTLNEYGLYSLKDKKRAAGITQEQIYQKLGLEYIPAELRENMGEIEAAAQKRLPKLVELKDIGGTFHNHTLWSDGTASHVQMVEKAELLKFTFLSFNDHFGPMAITNPLNEQRLPAYLKEIEKARKSTSMEIFSGIEIDILKDGTLSLSSSKLRELDVVVASIHLAQKMPSDEMTKRICHALENYPINILGHPTARLLNVRDPISFDMRKVFETAKDNNIFLEINSSPQRMDLPSHHIKYAKELGCQFALSTDAHDQRQLEFWPLGVMNARRGWLEKKDILNCFGLEKIKNALEK